MRYVLSDVTWATVVAMSATLCGLKRPGSEMFANTVTAEYLVWGVGFSVQGSEMGVWGLGFQVPY